MNTTTNIEDSSDVNGDLPGNYLAKNREQQGYSTEYVAGKLHLRLKMIELLEKDDYKNMPEAVFIKGYLRAYARLLNLPSAPLLEIFNQNYSAERKSDKALWQSRRETHRAEHAVRWVTAIFTVVVLTAVSLWWNTNKGNEQLFPKTEAHNNKLSHNQSETEIRLTDLSKMRSLLSSSGMNAALEEQSGD